ncbi:GLOBIN domain-containing protein [Aphelenchoides fujianensis]|nr:GLOBIN domain-containing protein [Aphelenchoides fujianensis]
MIVDLSMLRHGSQKSKRRESVASTQSTTSPTIRNFFSRFTYEHRTRSIDSDKIVNWEPDSEARELIKLTWCNDLDFLYQLGESIFNFVFTHVPESRLLFPDIHKHGENYTESREFRSQTLKFAQEIGAKHVQYAGRGFVSEHWDLFLDAMEVSLIEQISTSFPDLTETQRADAAKVWRRLAFFIISNMKNGYQQALKEGTHHSKHSAD